MTFIILKLLFSFYQNGFMYSFSFQRNAFAKIYRHSFFVGNNSHTKTWYLLLCTSPLCSFAIFCSLLSILLLIGQRKHLNCNQIVGKNMYICLVNVDNLKFNHSYHFLIEMIIKKFFFISAIKCHENFY